MSILLNSQFLFYSLSVFFSFFFFLFINRRKLHYFICNFFYDINIFKLFLHLRFFSDHLKKKKKKFAKATTTNYEATIAALSERPNSPRFFNYSYGLYDLNFYFANQIWVMWKFIYAVTLCIF